ncbi:NAD(P)/FAD-dependent oxidoreductase [Humitalea sp. 24SJ18S-53]|uniref:NAD(P)/FAD-dependent oxidoreductase n=1 Tax=Humitalea sp. 24SJ18S-53 TaxID=3422307 RepID=UPI003D670364
MQTFDALVIGAGAAGLMCAISAGRRGRRVAVIEHLDHPGAKILISGGGRCNFTNREAPPDRFLSANAAFCRSALSQFTPQDVIDLVNAHGIAWHEKTLGQLFCDGSARQIVAMLMAECRDAGVEVLLGHRVTDVAAGFTVTTDRGTFTAPSLVLATGGLSIPKMGATGFAIDVARRFGLPIVPTRPALVPLTFQGEALDIMRPLSGLSLEVSASTGRAAFREGMVFTHRGVSGPAVLQVSSYWTPGQEIALDLAPGIDVTAGLLAAKHSRPKAQATTVLGGVLPGRLAEVLGAATRLADMPDRDLARIGAAINAWRLVPSGTEGYAKAEVMAGGVDTRALSQRSLEARAVPGLFVVGEAVDVTGWLGGYNFQWAWSSGWAAGQAV